MSKNPPKLSDIEYLYDSFDNLPSTKVLTNVVECAERNRIFPPQSPFPGKMKYDKTPYMIEPAMELSPQSDTEEVVIMKCGQGGATACASEPLMLFGVMEDPSPMLAITATDELAKTWQDDRLDPMYESAGAMKIFRSNVSKNTQHGGNGQSALKKTFPGGRLDIKTYGKIDQIRQISYKYIILEEEETAGNAKQSGVKQGNFRDIAYARTRAFRGRRKILRISTPLIEQSSIINAAFLAGDQRYYHVPCPNCGHMQKLEWKNLKYTTDEHNHILEDSVYYECQHEECNFKIRNEHKLKMLRAGKWVPENAKKARPKTKSYTFSALYVPPGMDTWEDLAQQYVDALGDSEKMQVFYNMNLGIPFSDYAEAPNPELLYALKGVYKRGQIPNKEEGTPLFTMIGADVQAGNKRGGEWVKGKESRIEASLWGFGLNGRKWLLDHYKIYGDTSDWKSGAFAKFKKMIVEDVFPMSPISIFIDAGHQTNQVKQFCDRSTNVFPIMGMGNMKAGNFKRIDLTEFQLGGGGPLPLYELSNNYLKRTIYNNLALRRNNDNGEYPTDYMMFPRDIEIKYFKQLTAEHPESIIKNGRHHHYEWNTGGRSNETFDCALYAWQAKNILMYEKSISMGLEATDKKLFWKWALEEFGLPKVTPLELIKKQKRLFEILKEAA